MNATARRPVPYERVKLSIQQRINEGGWQPGFRLPSERELVEQFGCARMTVFRALRELEADGLIERRQGSGSFVAELNPISNILKIRDIRDEIAERGHVHTARVCSVGKEKATPEVATAMRLRKGSSVFRCLIVHMENGVPIQLEDRHVNSALVPNLMEEDFTSVTPSRVLFENAPLTEAEQVVEAVLATPEQADLLDVPESSALLMVSRRTVSQGRVASIARLYHPGGRFRLFGSFAAPGQGGT